MHKDAKTQKQYTVHICNEIVYAISVRDLKRVPIVNY
mgnify:CR=1 FL=1